MRILYYAIIIALVIYYVAFFYDLNKMLDRIKKEQEEQIKQLKDLNKLIDERKE